MAISITLFFSKHANKINNSHAFKLINSVASYHGNEIMIDREIDREIDRWRDR